MLFLIAPKIVGQFSPPTFFKSCQFGGESNPIFNYQYNEVSTLLLVPKFLSMVVSILYTDNLPPCVASPSKM